MKSLILSLTFAVGLLLAGCGATQTTLSKEALLDRTPTERAAYRDTLDIVDQIIDQAKEDFDEEYNRDGTPIEPELPEEPAE